MVLAPVALFVAYLGGWPFVVFWGAVALIVLWEWTGLALRAEQGFILPGAGLVLVVAQLLAGSGFWRTAVLAIAVAACAAAGYVARDKRLWAAGAVLYAGAMGLAPVLVRQDPTYGLSATLLLFAVVWGTDMVAYFVGRAVGGPKLMPHVSPKKTWSGAVGGTAGAVLAAIFVARLANLPGLAAVGGIALLLSIASQAGDLFESAVKRHFGAKDASHLIPGHGGAMDRLDGFVAAALVAAVLGAVRGGLATPAAGFLIW